MADLKISQLTGATTPLGGTEEVPLVQSGATKKVSVANLTAGRAIAASSVTVGNGRTQLASTYVADVPGPTGNNTGILFGGNTIFPCDGNGSLTNGVASLGTSSYQWYDIFLANNVNIRTAAKGVNFTANTPAAGMTSQLLNWYEEGTWTPTVSAISGAYTTVSVAQGSYTRIGRQVTLRFNFTVSNKGTGANGFVISGLPFTANGGSYSGSGFNASNATGTVLYGVSMSTQFEGYRYDGTDPVVANQSQVGVITYFV